MLLQVQGLMLRKQLRTVQVISVGFGEGDDVGDAVRVRWMR